MVYMRRTRAAFKERGERGKFEKTEKGWLSIWGKASQNGKHSTGVGTQSTYGSGTWRVSTIYKKDSCNNIVPIVSQHL